MTLARRMWLASAVLALFVGAAFTALILAVSAQREATEREARSKDVTVASLQLERLVSDVEAGFLGFTVTRSESSLDPYRSARQALPRRLQRLQDVVADDPSQRAKAQLLATRIDEYVNLFIAQLVPLLREEPGLTNDAGLAQSGKVQTDEIGLLFRNFRAAENKLARDAASDADARTNLAVLVGAVAVGVSMALITLFGIVLARSIGRPIRAAASGANRIAGGELSLRLPPEGPGEVGELTRAFNSMAERLEQGREELEAQNEELRESERMKTELVSIVSHELRTPLASVLGFTALLLKRDFDPPTRRHYLGIIDVQARRLAALLEDFLDVQRIEHEGVDLATEMVDLAELLDEQAQLYAAQSPKHRLEVELAERPLTVRGDPNRLAQVVGNLLSNAIKYSPDGGTVELVAMRSSEGVRIAVRDEGRGIAADQQDRIFTKFFRGDAGATGYHRHRPRPRGLTRDRRGARWQHRLRHRPGRGQHVLARAAGSSQRRRTDDDERGEGGGGMSKRLGWLLAGAAAGILVAGPWQSPSAASTGPATIRINDRQLKVTRVDIGAPGISPGDTEIVSTVLLQRGDADRDRPRRARLHVRRQRPLADLPRLVRASEGRARPSAARSSTGSSTTLRCSAAPACTTTPAGR